MSLQSGQAKLQKAVKSLREKWGNVTEVWDDRVASEYEKNHIADLEDRVARTLSAIDRLAQVIHEAEQAVT